MRAGAVAGIQDMGAAGLTSSSCEMAARAGTGIELDLSLVPQREAAMTAYEIMLSESQERMLIVAHSGRERQVIDIFRKWDLDAVVIGRVTDTGSVVVVHEGEKVADIPSSYLTDEAPRYVVCVGARPLAITNCLNFASPERPEVMWAFSEVVDGMAEACAALGTPVVSGNVSFYNETEGRGIHPTPVIGMVGLIEDVRRVVTQGFKRDGHLIALVGETAEDLAASEYEATVQGRTLEEMTGAGERVPRLDLERERKVQEATLRAAEEGLLQSAHDCADGGLAVALAESCFSSLGRERVGRSVE